MCATSLRSYLRLLGSLAALSALAFGVRAYVVRAAVHGALTETYPAGRWRLAPASELDRVVLFVSHILVRHRDVSRREPAFAAFGWITPMPPVTRSRAEAQARAEQIHRRLQRSPSDFAALARECSDDSSTKDRGGSLGARPASQFIESPQILDALASLRPGEVSRVIETDYGFHVLLRRAPPAPQSISAQRIVVGYDTSPWLRFQARAGHSASRTREQAEVLAAQIRAEAAARPAAFSELVTRYSEASDAERSGDIGVWSNRESSPLGRELEQVSALAIGEVSHAIDSAIGFQIFKRVALTERQTFAASVLKLRFEPDAPAADGRSRDAVKLRAEALLSRVRADPSSFVALRQQYCCERPLVWTVGRGSPALTTLLAETPIDTVAEHVVQVDDSWVIARRIVPPPAPDLLFELPEPLAPDLAYLVGTADPRLLAATTRRIGEELRSELRLTSDQDRELARIYDNLALSFESSSPDERVQHFTRARALFQQCLGAEGFQRFMQRVEAKVSLQLLGSAS